MKEKRRKEKERGGRMPLEKKKPPSKIAFGIDGPWLWKGKHEGIARRKKKRVK